MPYALRSSPGSLAMLAAMRRASSRVSSLRTKVPRAQESISRQISPTRGRITRGGTWNGAKVAIEGLGEG